MPGYVTAELDGYVGVSCGSTRFFLYRNHGLFGRLLSLIAWLLLAPTVVAAPPFVAGFDRFGQDRESQIGRLLLTELSCTACHVDRDRALQPKRGPALDGAAVRLQPKWIRQFLMSPQQTKPGTTMPDMFADWDAVEKQKAIDARNGILGNPTKADADFGFDRCPSSRRTILVKGRCVARQRTLSPCRLCCLSRPRCRASARASTRRSQATTAGR